MTREEEIALRKAKALELFRSRQRAAGHSVILAALSAAPGQHRPVMGDDGSECGGRLRPVAGDAARVVVESFEEITGDGVVSGSPADEGLHQSVQDDGNNIGPLGIVALLCANVPFVFIHHDGRALLCRYDTGEWQEFDLGSLP